MSTKYTKRSNKATILGFVFKLLVILTLFFNLISFGYQGPGIRDQGTGNRDQGTGIREQKSGYRDHGSGNRKL